jgi:nucleotide-binding universal stress UspA family protein
MTIKTILVPVRGDGKGAKVLDYALAAARRFNAHIDVVHTRPKPEDLIPFATLSMGGAVKRQITESANRAAEIEESRLKKLFEKYVKAKKVPITDKPDGKKVTAAWREATGKQSTNVALYGRLADLIVVPQPDELAGTNTLEAALMETGKLVLMAPAKPVKATLFAHVAFGWDGGTEAAKAVTGALPILEAARRVTVFSAPVSTEPRLPVETVVEYLRRHGIKAAVKTLNVKASGVGDALLGGAAKAGADVLLMGAFGQSRGRELVMGSVTRHIIDTAKMPVVLMH